MDRISVIEAMVEAAKVFKGEKHSKVLEFFGEYIPEGLIVDAVERELFSIPTKEYITIAHLVTKSVNAVMMEYMFGYIMKHSAHDAKSVKALTNILQHHGHKAISVQVNGTWKVIPGRTVSYEGKRNLAMDMLAHVAKFKNINGKAALKNALTPTKIDKVLNEMDARKERLSSYVLSTLGEVIARNSDEFEWSDREAKHFSEKGRVKRISFAHAKSFMNAEPVDLQEHCNDMYHRCGINTVPMKALDKVRKMQRTLDIDQCNSLLTLLAEENQATFRALLLAENKDESAIKGNMHIIADGITESIKQWIDNKCNPWYSNWKIDFRGRMYEMGILSSVSTKAHKAMLRAGREEALGETGYSEIKKAIVGLLGKHAKGGHERHTWAERLEIFEANKEELLEIGCTLIDAPVEGWKMVLEMDSEDAWAMASHLIELARIEAFEGDKREFKSNLILCWDATSSACQLIALMTQSQHWAETSNIAVKDGVEPRKNDAYMVIADAMSKAYKAVAEKNEKYSGFDKVWEEKVQPNLGLRRAFAKTTMMKRLYSGTLVTMMESCRGVIKEKGLELDVDSSSFGTYVGQVFDHAWEATDELKDLKGWETLCFEIADKYAEAGKVSKIKGKKPLTAGENVSWVYNTPGYDEQIYEARYYVEDRDDEGKQIRGFFDGKKRTSKLYGGSLRKCILPNRTKRVQAEMTKDKAKLKSSLPPHLIHTLDSLTLQLAVLGMTGDVDMVLTHDSLGCVAGRSAELLEKINEAIRYLFKDGGRAQIKRVIDRCKEVTGCAVAIPEGFNAEMISMEDIKRATVGYC